MWDEVGAFAAVAGVLLVCIIAVISLLRVKSSHRKPVRVCPLCKSELAENETLKGLIVDSNPPQKILIRGCSRCAPKTEGGSW